MSVYNELKCTIDGAEVVVQFKFGDVRQYRYMIGERIIASELLLSGMFKIPGVSLSGGSLEYYEIELDNGYFVGAKRISKIEFERLE